MAYQLVLDNKKRIDTDSYLKDEMTEAHDAQLQYPSGEFCFCPLTHAKITPDFCLQETQPPAGTQESKIARSFNPVRVYIHD